MDFFRITTQCAITCGMIWLGVAYSGDLANGLHDIVDWALFGCPCCRKPPSGVIIEEVDSDDEKLLYSEPDKLSVLLFPVLGFHSWVKDDNY